MHTEITEDELKPPQIHKVNKRPEIRVLNTACSILQSVVQALTIYHNRIE